MQRVERKKHENRKRRRLAGVILCALALAGGITAGILLKEKAQEKPPEARQRITGSITAREAEELKSVTVTQRGEAPWTAVREEDGSLRLEPEDPSEPNAWVVDESIANQIIKTVTNMTYEDVFTENREDWEADKADFGLADPKITAMIRFTDGTEITARIGDAADDGENAVYYLSVDGDDRLYAVDAGTVEDLNTERELLHPVHQLEIRGALLDRITVKNSDGTVRTEWKLQGQITDQDAAENWLITEPFTYPADYDTIRNLRDTAENLRLGVYIGEAEEEALKQCGLDEPTAILELHMAAGSTGTVGESGVYDVEERTEQTETLAIGGSKTEMVAYVRFGDEIYTVNHFTLNVFTQAEPLSTAARYTVMTPLNSLDSVTVEKKGADTVRYALVRAETPEGGESGEAEENAGYRCMRNGDEISYDSFSAAWERLLTVTVSGKLPAGYEPGEPHTRYTFSTVSGGTHTVELSDYDGIHDAVTLDGYTLFYLIKGGMTELP